MKNFARLEERIQTAYPDAEAMRAQKPADRNTGWRTTLKDVEEEKIYEFELRLEVGACRRASFCRPRCARAPACPAHYAPSRSCAAGGDLRPASARRPDGWRVPPLRRVADRAACGRHASRAGCARRRLLRGRRLHRQDHTEVLRQMEAAREQAAADVLDPLALQPAPPQDAKAVYDASVPSVGPSYAGHRLAPPAPLDTRPGAAVWQVRARLGGDDRRARARVRLDRGPSDQRAGGLGTVRAHHPNRTPRCIRPQCMQRAWPPRWPRLLPLQVRARRESPAGAGSCTAA